MKGWQSGFVDLIEGNMKGVQIGFVNCTETLHGLQIGLVNINNSGVPFKFLPIINYSF